MGRARSEETMFLPKGMALKNGRYYIVSTTTPRAWKSLGLDLNVAMNLYREITQSDDRFKSLLTPPKPKPKKRKKTPLENRRNFSVSDIYAVSVEMHGRALRRAAASNISFDLSAADVEFMYIRSKIRCELSGIGFSFEVSNKRWKSNPWVPSIDRIDSSKGYTLSNCRIVCHAVNRGIGEWGDDVFLKVCQSVVENRL